MITMSTVLPANDAYSRVPCWVRPHDDETPRVVLDYQAANLMAGQCQCVISDQPGRHRRP
jgi:hypothetical protein